MSLTRFITTTPTSLINGKLVLSGATKIILTPYSNGEIGSTSYELESIVADSLAITQDDPETNSIDCETSDTPIKTTKKEGAYNISMTNVDIQKTILTSVFGFVEKSITVGSGTVTAAVAPESDTDRYACIEIVFGDDAELVCPKVNLATKVDVSSVKRETVKCSIEGSCELATIGTGAAAFKTPFFVVYPTT